MIENLLHPRTLENRDWATLLFVFSFVIVAFNRSYSANRFDDFLKLLYSNKYMKIYKDGSFIMSIFTISLFFVQLISFAFFIQLLLSNSDHASRTDGILYIQIITFLSFFILSKFLIEKIIASAFNIEDFVEQFNMRKVTYRTYIGILLLPVNLFLFYRDDISPTFAIVIVLMLLVVNVLLYSITIKHYQSAIFSKMFYFILYLCTLELAPYCFMYYWFTKSRV